MSDLLLGVIGAGIQAGATIGSAAITASATKTVAKYDAKAAIQVALAQERVRLVAEQSETERTKITAKRDTSNTNTVAAVVGLALLGLLLVTSGPKNNPHRSKGKRARKRS